MKMRKTLLTLFFLAVFTIGVNHSASSSVFAGSDPVAQAYVSKTEIQWQPKTKKGLKNKLPGHPTARKYRKSEKEV